MEKPVIIIINFFDNKIKSISLVSDCYYYIYDLDTQTGYDYLHYGYDTDLYFYKKGRFLIFKYIVHETLVKSYSYTEKLFIQRKIGQYGNISVYENRKKKIRQLIYIDTSRVPSR